MELVSVPWNAVNNVEVAFVAVHKRALIVLILVVLALACAIAAEALRCGSTALPTTVRRSAWSTYSDLVVAYGPPDYEITLESPPGSSGDHRLSSVGSGMSVEKLRASVWDRSCFVIACQRLIVVSDYQSGQIVFSGGYSQNTFPTFVLPDDLPSPSTAR